MGWTVEEGNWREKWQTAPLTCWTNNRADGRPAVITEKGNRIPPKSFATTSTVRGKDSMKNFLQKVLGSEILHYWVVYSCWRIVATLSIESRDAGLLFIVRGPFIMI